MEKILIKNSTIYDGTGAHPFQSDILIQNGKILITGVKSLEKLNEAYDFINKVFKTNYENICLSC